MNRTEWFARAITRRMRTQFRKMGSPKKIRLDGVDLKIDRGLISATTLQSMFYEAYEYAERSILATVLRPGDTMLDVGAGIGYLSIAAAKMLGRDNAVYCVEANPGLIRLIHENAELNKVRLSVFNTVLGSEDGLVDFYIHQNFWSSSAAPAPGAKRVTVQQRETNAFLRKLHPNILLVDIEGGEVDLFRNIDLQPISKLCIEVHPERVGRPAISSVVISILRQGLHLSPTVSRGNSLYFER